MTAPLMLAEGLLARVADVNGVSAVHVGVTGVLVSAATGWWLAVDDDTLCGTWAPGELELVCRGFLMCDNAAEVMHDAGPVGMVPACQSCADRLAGARSLLD